MSRFAIIMAGGSGTRFWPKSSRKKPKQLIALTDRKSMLQLSFDRLQGLIEKKNRWIVSTQELRGAIAKQLGSVTQLSEPEGRNTMAAVCWSAWQAHKKNPDSSLVVLPADAHIKSDQAYRNVLKSSFELAETQNRIVCIGIRPTFAATGYGYIEAGEPLGVTNSFEIKKFVEKPPAERAVEFVSSGKMVWNAGIFVFKTRVFIDETRKYAPVFARAFDELMLKPRQLKKTYQGLPKEPVDKAIMEKTGRGGLVFGDFGWNDVGSWRALDDVISSNDPSGIIQVPGGFCGVDSHRVIVNSTTKKFVGLVGVKDLVIVETDQALLVCAKDRSEEVKTLVQLIEKNKKLAKRLL